MGILPQGPTFIGTDNLSNALVASDQGTASRSRHFLRRYYAFLQRVKAGEVAIGHVPDADNPADFLTKWLPAPKFNRSIEYVTNQRNFVTMVRSGRPR